MKSLLPFSLLLALLLGPFASFTARALGPPAPTSYDSQAHLTDVSCKFAKLAWTNGDADHHALVMADLTKTNGAILDVSPAQGVVVAGSAFFGTGGYTQNDGFAVYTGAGNAVSVRNLIKGHEYIALLYPYNEDVNTGDVTYLLTPPDTLRFTTPGCPDVSPTVGATNLQSTPLDCSSIRLSCTAGNGQGRLFVIRKSRSAFNGDVSIDQENYLFPSNLFARGFETKIQSGCYAVYAGPSTQVTVYGLAPDQIYKWAVYEYNTVPGPDGMPDGVTPFYAQSNIPVFFTSTTACSGTEPAVSSVDNKQHQTSDAAVLPNSLYARQVSIKWHPSITPRHNLFGSSTPIPAGPTSDDGVGSYVVIHNAFAQDALPLPLQNTTPDHSSSLYGLGSPVRPGMDSIYSVKLTYDWTDTTVLITGLRPSTPYTVNVFTFRFPAPQSGVPPARTPFTYFLSSPQGAVTFTTAAAPPLPVTLVRFMASHRLGASEVQLSWATASELNNTGFGIERSLDGRIYTRLGFVPSSAGTSSTARSYLNTSPYVGAAYYRLRQVDISGKATYSHISYVRDESLTSPLAVFPNPTTANFTVLGADLSQPLEVYDLLGQRVLTLPAGVSEGSLGALPGGVYVLRQGVAYTRLVRR